MNYSFLTDKAIHDSFIRYDTELRDLIVTKLAAIEKNFTDDSYIIWNSGVRNRNLYLFLSRRLFYNGIAKVVWPAAVVRI